ncbi:MAG TPA: CotH kinase family protein, partial [Verrucomicrobiales bacterium]|nr:CotH kinase family protein [Verrucomicrobiales bacterium]
MIPCTPFFRTLALISLAVAARVEGAPVIDSVSQTPAFPRPVDAVRIEARATGAVAVLRWREDGGTFQSLPMVDTNGDGRVEANVGAQPNGKVIEFFIDATDGSGTATWPAGTVGALWRTDAAAPGAWTPGAQPLCFAVLREQDRLALASAAAGTGFSGTFAAMDGTGTAVRYGCTIRSTGGTPQSLTVEFPAGDPWQGRTALEVNSQYPHSQVLAAAVWRRAGLAAGEAVAVHFRLNGVDAAEAGGRMFGRYARAEAPNEAWLLRQYPLDAQGNLYRVNDEGAGTHGELSYEIPATPANYAETYFPLTHVAGAGYADVMALTDKLSNAPEATYKTEISQVLQLDQWLSYLALDALTGNVKAGLQSGRGTGFYLYRGVNDPRFVLAPHGMDTSFGLGENGTGDPVARSIFSYENVQGLSRMMNHPDILPDYYAKLLALSDTVFSNPVLDPLVDQLLGGWADAVTVQQVKGFITSRRAAVLAQIPQTYAMSITTAAADVEGMKRTTDGGATVSGSFHAGQVRSIRVNGVPATLYYRTSGLNAAGSWACELPAAGGPLHPGVNIVKARFYDGPNGTGNVVKELTAAVYHSGGTGTNVSGTLGTGPGQNLFHYGVYNTNPNLAVVGSTWKYLTNGTNPGATWKSEGFVDTGWSSGASQIGFGDSPRDEQTIVTRVDFDPGTSGTQSVPTSYFRNTFTLADVSQVASLPGEVTYDDGAVVYVNGTEVLRTPNLAAGAGHTDYADFNGAATTENAVASFTIPMALVHNGVNTIAVEVHQHDAASADLTFDLKLDAVPKPTTPAFQWTLAGSPYHLTGDTTIPAGVTLTIDAGVSVFADPGKRLTVSGIIKALGTADAPLRFSNVPGAPLQDDPREPGTQMAPPKWGGILVTDSLSPENVIRYADFVNAQPAAVEGAITVVRSECLVDHCSFRLSYLHGVYGKNCSLTVQDCYFPNVFPAGKESLGETLDNLSEMVEVDSSPTDPGVMGKPEFFKGFPVGGHLRLYRNVFEGSFGHNDLVDVTSGKWGLTPVFDVQDNIFLGPTGDEHLDLNGDAYIAGNYFQNCAKDAYTSDHGYANGVSADVTEPETTVVIARNVFTRVDHGVNVKKGVGAIFEHNTMADINQDYHFEKGTFSQDVKTSAINCFIPDDQGPVPGDGAYVAFNLFYGSVPSGGGAASGFPRIFSWADRDIATAPPFTTKIEMANNFLDPALLDPVIGARHPDDVYAPVWQPRTGDPLFVDRAARNFALQPYSPARGTAPPGFDYGAGIAAGCYFENVPAALTPETSAAITIGGPGIFSYKWRLDAGTWSAPVEIAPGVFPRTGATVRKAILTIPVLADGAHTLEVLGQDFAGNWQAVPATAAWTVQSTLQRVEISEVLADALAGADTVELHNAGAGPVLLTG